jgi:hypothetical protein
MRAGRGVCGREQVSEAGAYGAAASKRAAGERGGRVLLQQPAGREVCGHE